MSTFGFIENVLGGVEVEWNALKEVAEYSQTRIDAQKLDASSFVGVDNLVAGKGGRVDANYLPNTTRITAYKPGDILIGNIRPYLKKVWKATNSGGCSGDVLAIRIADSHSLCLSSEFLYYLLSSDAFFAYNMKHAKGAKMPRGNKAAIMDYQIPIPCPDNPAKSLKIQAEIVRILDAFSANSIEVISNLSAEKALRLKQHSYYREQLLNVEDVSLVWKSLEEVAFFANGKGHEKDIAEGGKYTVVNSKFISTNGNIAKLSHKQIAPLFKDDILLVMSDLPNGKALSRTFLVDQDDKYTLNQRIGRITIKDDTEVLPKFLFHFLNRIQQLLRYNNGVDQTNLRKGQILDVQIPLVSIREQKKLVKTLDRFNIKSDVIINALSDEIELRQKQYEYYCDLLLGFPKPHVTEEV